MFQEQRGELMIHNENNYHIPPTHSDNDACIHMPVSKCEVSHTNLDWETPGTRNTNPRQRGRVRTYASYARDNNTLELYVVPTVMLFQNINVYS